MARIFCLVAALCIAVSAAPPPSAPPRLYQQQNAGQFQTLGPLDYYMENSEVAAFYNQARQKPREGAPERLETLEPDSEVELIPGAQQPQQPPQQNPVAPNVPGLLPGQRVFIVQMPVPGYRPGTIAGYQPVYIVAAAPQGNTAYAANGIPGGIQGIQGVQGVAPGIQGIQGVPGYQNAILVNPGAQGQVVAPVNPFFGYPGGQGPAGLLIGGPLAYRGFQQVYQQQVDPGFAYQNAGPGSQQQHLQQQQQEQLQQRQHFQQHQQFQHHPQQQLLAEGPRGVVQLSQLIGLHQDSQQANAPRNAGSTEQSEQQKRVGAASESVETKEALREESRRSPKLGQQRKP